MSAAEEEAIEAFERLLHCGRSSQYGFRRRQVMNAGAYARALQSRQDPRGAPALARRARILRLLGREEEAEAGFDRALALDAGHAPAHAWRWELGLARRPRGAAWDEHGIDKAIALEPENYVWRLWRAIGRLTALPVSAYSQKPNEAGRAARSPKAVRAAKAALEDLKAALRLSGGCALAYAVAALAHDDLEEGALALPCLDAAILREPRQAWLYELRANLRRRRGDGAGFVRDAENAVLLDEGLGYFQFAAGMERGCPRPKLLKGVDRFLSSHREAYWMLAFRADCRRSPEVNDFAGALRDLERAVRLKPDCAWAWAYLSRARMNAATPAEALAAIDRAVALRGDCGWFYAWRGEVLRRLGDPRRALADLDRGLSLDPDYEIGYAWRGETKRGLGLLEEARADLDLAVELNPGNAWALKARFSNCRELGLVSEALDDLERCRRLDPKFRWCSAARDADRDIALLDAEIAARPGNFAAYAWRGDSKMLRGDARGALADFRRALALNPGHALSRAWLGRALGVLGRPRAAVRELDRALALAPGDAYALAWRGRARRESGDLAGALSDLTSACRRETKTAWIFEWKAETEAALGFWKAAAGDYTQALALDRGNWKALAARAQAWKKLGRPRAAQTDLKAVLEAMAPRRGAAGVGR